ncbi:uncharacterized protein [Anser cygnoides]|uniref:uncharacterized protein isoform X3 n=1 Tax=Anser cygnoides TaxID=8845 RepID=UPI0034D191A0
MSPLSAAGTGHSLRLCGAPPPFWALPQRPAQGPSPGRGGPRGGPAASGRSSGSVSRHPAVGLRGCWGCSSCASQAGGCRWCLLVSFPRSWCALAGSRVWCCVTVFRSFLQTENNLSTCLLSFSYKQKSFCTYLYGLTHERHPLTRCVWMEVTAQSSINESVGENELRCFLVISDIHVPTKLSAYCRVLSRTLIGCSKGVLKFGLCLI